MAKSNIEILPLTNALGAEILGIDLADRVGDAELVEIRQAFLKYGVIFFRDQQITEEQHEAFAERFAPINVNRFFKAVPGHPRIAEVRKEPDQKTNIGGGWHTDHSYDLVPAMGSVLLAREVPESGGDTLFASMALAYEALSEGLKRTLETLRAEHSARHVFGDKGSYANGSDLKDRIGNASASALDAVHPLVIRHPETGQKTLYVNPGFTVRIEGWTTQESDALLQFLYAHASRPEFTCRFRWRKGSIAFWDNRATWHYAANDYHGSRRLMHRITLEGSPLH